MTAHEAVQVIERSALFNAEWYTERYPDVKAANMNPAEHFYKYGWKMMRDPSNQFSTASYLAEYGDIKKDGMNPLLHYLRFGEKEGRAIFSSKEVAGNHGLAVLNNKNVPSTGGTLTDSNSHKIEKQLENTQALLEHYFNRCQELEYQSMDKQ
ncbi:hypothetical protein ACT3TJ_08845 [Halomonas sp. AOP30-A1-24]|uniref:hypothetical protein n=1 Tax=Halomonas sp. AOP30-A1-24 TaxID=3457698 RepID=UPI004033CF26